MKQNKKKWLLRIACILAFLLIFFVTNEILRFKADDGIHQARGLYSQKKNSIDVVFMGTSHMHCNVNTALLYEDYGIAAYDYSAAEQPLWITYYYLQELLKYQKPQVIVLDVYGPARFKEDFQYRWVGESIYGMRFSNRKLQMLNVSLEKEEYFNYYPDFLLYHERYGNLTADDLAYFPWNRKALQAFKGYTPYLKKVPQEYPEKMEAAPGGLTDKSAEYLDKIIDLAKDRDIRLVFVTTPYVYTAEDQSTFEEIKQIAEAHQIPFWDYHRQIDSLQILPEEDFNDYSHLNYWGGLKLTTQIGQDLKNAFSLPDRRGEAGYESYEDHVKEIAQKIVW